MAAGILQMVVPILRLFYVPSGVPDLKFDDLAINLHRFDFLFVDASEETSQVSFGRAVEVTGEW